MFYLYYPTMNLKREHERVSTIHEEFIFFKLWEIVSKIKYYAQIPENEKFRIKIHVLCVFYPFIGSYFKIIPLQIHF